MERGIREIKESIREQILKIESPLWDRSRGDGRRASSHSILTLPDLSQSVVTQWNHRRRRCLQQRTSCAMLAAGKNKIAQYHLRQRKEMQNCINELQAQIESERGWTAARIAPGQPVGSATARRLAIETWLQREGLLTLARSQNVLPCFQPKLVH